MQVSEQLFLEEFESGLEVAESVVTRHLSAQCNGKSIAINRLPFLDQQFVCLRDETNPNHISVMQFLKLCTQKWYQELQYQNEILLLKEQIIEIFNQVCDGLENEELIIAIRNSRQTIIEALFKLCKPDQKQAAGSFCKGLMNGFEIETLDNFEHYALHVLLVPLVTALPVGLIEYIREILEKDVSVVSDANLTNAASKIMKFMKEYFKLILVKTNEIESSKAFEIFIEENLLKRKLVSVMAEDPKIFESILNKQRANISFVNLRMEANDFINKNISFSYEGLELYCTHNGSTNEKAIAKLPKTLKKLLFDFVSYQQLDEEEIARLADSVSKISSFVEVVFDLKQPYFHFQCQCLRLSLNAQQSNHQFNGKKASALAALIKQAQCKVKILTDNFSYKNENATDKEMEEIKIVLAESSELKSFSIDCRQKIVQQIACSGDKINEITQNGIKDIGIILKRNKNLKCLQLNFRQNNV